MRTFLKLMVGAAAAATVAAMAVAPVAMADPPGKTVPKPADVVGTGSDTIQNLLNQLGLDYNAAHKTGAHLYSWNATNPTTGAIHDPISTKKGCKAIPRPNGSSEGILALTTENKSTSGHPCIDYGRSSRNRAPTDPAYAPGGISFITLGGDAVTYATQPGSNAPKNLTTAQLFAIYSCKDTNWSQVGGKPGKIKAYIPQTGSGTRSFFLTAVGFPTGASPGTCVSDLPTKAVPGGTLEENEGINPALNKDKANVIFPFSIGKYLSEKYHSAKCYNSTCTKTIKGSQCPAGSKGTNLFGCDIHGTMVLNSLNGTAPTASGGKGKPPVVNPKFTAAFTRSLYIVVQFPKKGGSNGIPSYLTGFFGPKGFTCTNKTAKTDLNNYGFVVFPAGSGKGHTINHCGDTH